MKIKKLLAGLLSSAMVAGTLAVPVFAEGATWDNMTGNGSIGEPSQETTVTVDENATISQAITINGDVTIKAAEGVENATITRGEAEDGSTYPGTLFKLADGAKLTLESVTIDAGGKWELNEKQWEANKAIALGSNTPVYDGTNWINDAAGPITVNEGNVTTDADLIKLMGGNTVTMENGAKITKIYSANTHVFGWDAQAPADGSFELKMADSEISHFAGKGGSLILPATSRTATITLNSGAKLCDNVNLGDNGGLFYLEGEKAQLNMNDGAEVMRNYGADCNGTFVITHNGGKFTMNGGKIYDNEGLKGSHNNYCQPIYAHLNGYFTMNGGEIYNNTGNNVGAVYQRVDNVGGTTTGRVELNGGKIYGNHYYGEQDVAFPSSESSLGQVFLTGEAQIDNGQDPKMEITGDVTFYGQAQATVGQNAVIDGNVSVMSEQQDNFEAQGETGVGVVIEGEVKGNLYTQESAAVENSGTVGGNVYIIPDDPEDSKLSNGSYNGESATVKGDKVEVDGTDRVGNMTVTMNSIAGLVVEEEAAHPADHAASYSLHAESLADSAVASALEKDEEDANSKLTYADIYVCRDNEKIEVTSEQTISIKINEPVNSEMPVYVYHYAEGKWATIKDAKFADGVVTFTTPSLSPFAISYTPAKIAEGEAATSITAALEPIGIGNEYNIVLKGYDADNTPKDINRFMSAEFNFNLENETGSTLTYTIEPGENITVIRPDANAKGVYEFNMDGTQPDISGKEITIGKVVFAGNGTGKFSIDKDTAIVNTATTKDNIVDHFVTEDSTEVGDGTLTIDPADVAVEVHAKKLPLTVNVMFPNEVAAQNANYTNMTVKIDSALTAPITATLGNGGTVTCDDANVEVGIVSRATDMSVKAGEAYVGYTFTVKVPEKLRYTVTFKGDGYRTYSHDVLVDEGKTVTVWNNVMDADTFVVSNGTADKDEFRHTFLAGDIDDSKKIDLYDLSAAVAYFGKKVDSTTTVEDGSLKEKDYIRYDLNRDGNIDSKDIAMVLVSWGY